jgi:hypothetical protein
VATRYFTVAEANRLLPALTERMQALRRLQSAAREKYEEMRRIRQVGYRQDGNLIMLTDYQQSKREFDQTVAEANRLLNEIHEWGCRVTDVEMGLVDFPAKVGGQDVYLCWRVGEPEVQFYHGLREGFTGRQPLPPNP